MKLQPTAGPKIAQTAFASWWSLASTQRDHARAARERREDDGAHARGGHAFDPPTNRGLARDGQRTTGVKS